jgi:hypothetical protein
MHQVGHQIGQSIYSVFRPTVFDRHGLTFRVAAFLKATTESAQAIAHGFNRSGINKTNYRQASLLSVSSKRPRGHTADCRKRIPPPHAITSSGRARRR